MPKKTSLIDEKDKRILEALDRNARQTDAEIARTLKTSKQVVNYRIQKLLENGVIDYFYTIINVGNLELNSYYVFLQLESINKKQEENLLNSIRNLPRIGWLVSGTGRWDAIVLIYAPSAEEFDKSLSNILHVCKGFVHEYNFTTLISAEHLEYKFLKKTAGSTSVKQTEKTSSQKLSETDTKIIAALSQNARASLLDISQQTKIPVHTVKYHLSRLQKEKVIEGFKPKINIGKLGYQWYLLVIQLQKSNEKRENELIRTCKHHKNIYYVTKSIGHYSLMLDVHVKNIEEFKGVLLDFKEQFSDVIKLYESFIIFKEHTIDYFPKQNLLKP